MVTAVAAIVKSSAARNPTGCFIVPQNRQLPCRALCDKNDNYSIDSLTKAIESFKDAILSLKAVEKPGYKTAEETYPHNSKYRVSGYPKDAFHIACIAHRTRLQNILRTPGLDPIEKALDNHFCPISIERVLEMGRK